MNIHTTKNLNSMKIRDNINSTNMPISNEFRLQHSMNSRLKNLKNEQDTYERSVSFRRREVKLIKSEVVKQIKNVADKEKKVDKVLKSDVFNSILDLMSHEVFVQSAISAIICMALRPLTIMALPTKKDKQDNMYASAHSISSGAVGVIGSLLISVPFSKGIKYAQSNYLKDMSTDILKRKYPNLDINSIWKDAAKTIRKPVTEWLDSSGNKFSTDFKNVMKVAKPKPIAEISEETLKKFGVDVDLKAMKDKSVNEWVDRNGKPLRFELKEMFIKVNEEKLGENFFSLEHIDKKFLKEVMPELDINSIEKNGKRLHISEWKNVNGQAFKLENDAIHLSSYRETADAVPLYTGRTRTDKKGDLKYLAYQNNNGIKDEKGTPSKLGSEIQQAWLDADLVNDISNKLLGWMPDILTRPIVASATIALIPMVLKEVFGLEKKKKPKKQPEMQPQMAPAFKMNQQRLNNQLALQSNTNNNLSFKGAKDGDWISRLFGKYYGKPMANKKWIQDLSEKFTKVPGSMIEHMATLGSLLTSSVYMTRTLQNKDLEPDKRRTLAINQGLCFIVPTLCAYFVNHKLRGVNKKLEYRYAGLQEQRKALDSTLTPEKIAEMNAKFGKRLKAFKDLTSLFTFTFIYRYGTPVLMTPAANWMGEKINAKKHNQEIAKK